MKTLGAVLLVILSLAPVFGTQRDVLLINDDKAEVFDLEQIINLWFANDFRTDPATIQRYEQKEKTRSQNALGFALDKAYKSQDPKQIEKATLQYKEEEDLSVEGPFPTVLKVIGLEEGVYPAFVKNNSQFVSDYVLANGCDMGIMITSTSENELIRCRIFVYEEGLKKVYEHIAGQTEPDFDESQAIFALMPYFYPEGTSLVVFEQSAPTFSTLKPRGRYAMARPGLYEYTNALGQTQVLEVPEGQIVPFDYAPAPKAPSPMLLTGFSNDIKIYSGGKLLGNTPLYEKSLSAPLALTGQKEGFKSLTIRSSKPEKAFQFDLIPQNAGDISLYQVSRNKFYTSLARTLIMFGGVVFFSSMEQKSLSFKAWGLAATGAAAISAADTVKKLFDYYKTSINIAL